MAIMTLLVVVDVYFMGVDLLGHLPHGSVGPCVDLRCLLFASFPVFAEPKNG